MPLLYTQLLESHSHATDEVSRYCKTLRNEQYSVLGPSFVNYAQLKDLRNQIVHEYVIDATVFELAETTKTVPRTPITLVDVSTRRSDLGPPLLIHALIVPRAISIKLS